MKLILVLLSAWTTIASAYTCEDVRKIYDRKAGGVETSLRAYYVSRVLPILNGRRDGLLALSNACVARDGALKRGKIDPEAYLAANDRAEGLLADLARQKRAQLEQLTDQRPYRVHVLDDGKVEIHYDMTEGRAARGVQVATYRPDACGNDADAAGEFSNFKYVVAENADGKNGRRLIRADYVTALLAPMCGVESPAELKFLGVKGALPALYVPAAAMDDGAASVRYAKV